MAVTYGYFNSLDGDRKYNADQMSEYFDGLVSNGVYQTVGGGLQVIASSGMSVNVKTGRAIINCKWLKNDAILPVSITAAHVTLNRYTAVIVRLDTTNRQMLITTKDGTAASNPTKPSMTQTSTTYEICLAYIYVAAGATAISQSNIEDARPSSACGWVTGLIKQVDTSELFLQFQAAYEEQLAEMASWEASMKTQFDMWFDDLSTNLNVDTFIYKYNKRVVFSSAGSVDIPLNMTGYTYNANDVIMVYINGLLGAAGVDYTLNTSGITPTVTPEAGAVGTDVNIIVLKSKIGFNILVGSDDAEIVDENNENIYV